MPLDRKRRRSGRVRIRGRLCQLRQTYKRGGNVGSGPPLWAYAKNTVVAEWRGGGGTGERARYKMKWGSRTETGGKKEKLIPNTAGGGVGRGQRRGAWALWAYTLSALCVPQGGPFPPHHRLHIHCVPFSLPPPCFSNFFGSAKVSSPLAFFFSSLPGLSLSRGRRGEKRNGGEGAGEGLALLFSALPVGLPPKTKAPRSIPSALPS